MDPASPTSGTALLDHLDVTLRPDPGRTVIRPFAPEYPGAFVVKDHSRTQAIVDRILTLDDAALADELGRVTLSLDERHRDVDAILLRRFDDVAPALTAPDRIDQDRRRLIGAYLSQEYAYESAALFNPSVVRHPEQGDVAEGAVRIVMSLRGIGEGHVSSVTFRTGVWTPGAGLEIDAPSPVSVAPIIGEGDGGAAAVELQCGGSRDISETVLYPILPSQRQGIEDMRLVLFTDDDGSTIYHGTYTAFSGAETRSELVSGSDFRSFVMRPLGGAAAKAKGMALFPRRIGGRYAMLSREDNENVWLTYSDDLYRWETGEKLLTPHAAWEFIQMGNCGSPIEIDEGWLVLTHGVGMVRNYCMGAALLDRDDPSKVLGRTALPILEPGPTDRDGYVPNVVYSCGGIVQNRMLLLPYGVADSFTTFATASVDDVLAAMG